eukprot:8708528-Lingulodinium_polyedra.AAC.1
MDQQKSIIPRSSSMKATSFMRNGSRIVVGLAAVLIPALTSDCLCHSSFEDYSHGSNFQRSL